jgi:hypothetical protein
MCSGPILVRGIIDLVAVLSGGYHFRAFKKCIQIRSDGSAMRGGVNRIEKSFHERFFLW